MTGHIDPTRDQFAAMMKAPDDGPIHMLNLIRLREKAAYEDGREATGADAGENRTAFPAIGLVGVGGRIIWSGAPQLMLIGPADEHWDIAFIAEYPGAAAFGQMVQDPAYQKAVKHRQAAVADSRLIRMQPRDLSA